MAADVRNTLQATDNTPTNSPAHALLSDFPDDLQAATRKAIPLSQESIAQTAYPSNQAQMRKPVSNDTNTLSLISMQKAAASAGIAPFPAQIHRNDLKNRENEDTKQLEKAQENLTQEIEKAKKQGDTPRANYLIQMSKLVGEISTLLNQWNSRDAHRLEEKKKKYHGNSAALQDNAYSKASASAISGIGGFLVSIAMHAAGSQDIQAVNSLISLAKDVWINSIDAGGVKPAQLNSLILSEVQKLNEASSSNDGLREKCLQILGEIKQWLEKSIARG